MLRYLLAGLMLPMLLSAGGCPADPPTDDAQPGDMIPLIDAPASAKNGETVAMKARFSDDATAANVTYQWFQTYGRAVEIINGNSADASFVAPSLATAQTLLFRLDVTGPDGKIYSEAITVLVDADPDYNVGSDEEQTEDDDPYPKVKFVTSMGDIIVKLNRNKAPLTVNNFLRYLDDGHYDNTLFHRVIADFMIQSGGFDLDLVKKTTRDPITNESDNGLTNDRGTIAMARQTDNDSATSQFFINVVDNEHLNPSNGANGYTVFGYVTSGMDVVDDISVVETESRDGRSDVPVEDVILERAVRLDASGAETDADGGDDSKGGDSGNNNPLSGG